MHDVHTKREKISTKIDNKQRETVNLTLVKWPVVDFIKHLR